MEDEAKFPFDVKGFQKSVDQMSKAISSMETKLNKFGGTMQKSVSKGIMSATTKIGLLVKGFKSVMKNMPEIGQAFKIAGDIMSKEFFFPIRQQIMPYLQKMLDWVRDHRTLFAKWGQTVADTIKTVIVVAKKLWNVLKDVSKMLTDSIQKGLGTNFKSIDEFMNVLSVKLTVVTLMIGDTLSKLVLKIGEFATAFTDGFLPPLQKLSDPINSIIDSFQRLLDLFGDNNSGIKGAFEWLGNFVGNQLLAGFEGLAIAIDTIIVGIQTLAQSGKLLKDLFTGDWSALTNDWKSMKSIFTEYGERTASHATNVWDAMKGSVGIDDGIVTKDGKVIQLNPQDNVYAFKGTPMGGITAPMNMVFNVTVAEGNAQVVGQQLGYAIHKSFVDRLKEQQMAGGW